MARKPKPYVKDGWYRTSVGGVKHRLLCPVEEGPREAELALARLLVAIDDAKTQGAVAPTPEPGVPPPVVAPEKLAGPPSKTVAQVYEEFMALKESENRGGTPAWYRDKLDPFFERFANRPLATLTLKDGLDYKTYLRHDKVWYRGKTRVRGLKDTTVNAHVRAAKTLLGWACKPSRRHQTGLLVNPWEEIGYLAEKPRERLISEEEFKVLLAHCTDGNCAGGAQDFRDQLTALRYTTLRPGELRKLRWDYIDWDNNRIVFPPQDIKTGRRREVTLIDAAKDCLRQRQRRVEAGGGRAGGLVFPAPDYQGGKRTAGAGRNELKANSLSQRFRRLLLRCVALGLIEKERAGERLVPYSTRHNRITEMFTEGVDQAVVMFDAGHVVPATTERYKHLAGSHVAGQVRQRSQAPRTSTGGGTD
jgi:integrase